MPYRGDIFTQGQYYHLYNRGAGRAKIFFNEGNYLYLLRLIKELAPKFGVAVIAYCLMPNHYHFLFRQETETLLSKFMQVLFNAYVQALNIQQGRTGTLFESFQTQTRGYMGVPDRPLQVYPSKPCQGGAGGETRRLGILKLSRVGWMRDGALVDKQFVQEHFRARDEYPEFVNDVEDEEKSYGKIAKYLFD